MRIAFDIKYRPQIESGEYKVETREGLPARIICWDRMAKRHNADDLNLCVLVPDDEGEAVYYYHRSGRRWVPNEDFDLFIVTPEEELTGFEKVVKDRLWRTLEYSETFRKDENKWTRELAAELLALAEKELGSEYSAGFVDGLNAGKADALKDLRWKKIDGADNACVREPHVGTNMVGEKMLYVGNHAISISNLEKLPGFKED